MVDEQRVKHDELVEQLGDFKTSKEKLVSQNEEGKMRKMKSIEDFGLTNHSNVLKGDLGKIVKQ